MKTIAVYPGSFDPITNGHLDIIERGVKMFDELIVLVAFNPKKPALFTVTERQEMIHGVITSQLGAEGGRIRVDSYSGLLINYAQDNNAGIILRGLRAVSDFEYEFQMALMNRKMSREVETVFLMTGYKWFYTASNMIKEAASFGGSVSGLVPESVEKELLKKYAEKREDVCL
ncbi:MAG: pantetheine-phosphate adenylyltransferase [Deltaproteobacteria bacterium]|nr:pantetheine-phosphate adenylyltransferase [Deltaproteobacteria bacterium]